MNEKETKRQVVRTFLTGSGPIPVLGAAAGIALVAIGVGPNTARPDLIAIIGASLVVISMIEWTLGRRFMLHERSEAVNQERILAAQRKDFVAALDSLGSRLRDEMSRLIMIFDSQGEVYKAQLHEARENTRTLKAMGERLDELEKKYARTDDRVRAIERRFGAGV